MEAMKGNSPGVASEPPTIRVDGSSFGRGASSTWPLATLVDHHMFMFMARNNPVRT